MKFSKITLSVTAAALVLSMGAAFAGVKTGIWGIAGLEREAAMVDASMASLEGLFKANPQGDASNSGLSQVLADRAADVATSLDTLSAALDTAMEGLSQEDRQQALNAYGELLVSLADLKRLAENRFLTSVSTTLGDSYTTNVVKSGIWGQKFSLEPPRTPQF